MVRAYVLTAKIKFGFFVLRWCTSVPHLHFQLHWPVMLLYPEYSESDLVQAFCENHTFDDHLAVRCFGVFFVPFPFCLLHRNILRR
jgi:hypothetical protein